MILLLWLNIWPIKCNLLLRCMEKLLKMLIKHKSNKYGHMVHGKVNKCFLDSRKKKPMWKWRSMGKRSPWHLTRKDLSYSWNILMVMVTLIRMKKEGSVWLKAKNSSSRTDSGGINKYFMLHHEVWRVRDTIKILKETLYLLHGFRALLATFVTYLSLLHNKTTLYFFCYHS